MLSKMKNDAVMQDFFAVIQIHAIVIQSLMCTS